VPEIARPKAFSRSEAGVTLIDVSVALRRARNQGRGLDHAVDHGVQGRNWRRRAAIVIAMKCLRDPADGAADTDPLDRAQAVFLSARRRLFGVAYGILHNPNEAEDVVQDAWLRWQATDRTAVVNAEAFLVTTTTRLAVNNAQSAWHRRETPAGSWLPEHPAGLSPEEDLQRGEAVEDTMLLLLAKLRPAERAAYLLRHAFDYPYDAIAQLLQFSNANCRQLVRRAGRSIESERRRPVSLTAHKCLVDAFRAAAHDGNFAPLEELLVAAVRRDVSAMPRSPASTRRDRAHRHRSPSRRLRS
jgi:RNA polymerase sigma factor (sigma-70 family)